MESWCSLLTLDPYLEICRTLGCSPETEEEQVALALNQSIHFDSSVVPSTMSSDTDTDSDRNRGIDFLQFSNLPCKLRTPIPRHTQRDGFAPPVSALWEKTKGDLVSSSILNPYLLRSVLKSDELESLSFVLVETRRSVRDLQAVLLLQLTQIAAAHGPPSLSPSLSSAHSHCHAHPPLHRYLILTLNMSGSQILCEKLNTKIPFLIFLQLAASHFIAFYFISLSIILFYFVLLHFSSTSMFLNFNAVCPERERCLQLLLLFLLPPLLLPPLSLLFPSRFLARFTLIRHTGGTT